MKMKNFLSIVFGAFFICSCTNALEIASEEKLLQEKQESFKIPIEDALSSLECFMKENGMLAETKGGLNDYIENYFAVTNPTTKAGYTDGDIIYAVNFKDDGGFALLSADSRIPDDIIAITEAGAVAESDFAEPEFEKVPSENDDLTVSEFEEMVESGVLAAQQEQIIYECMVYAMQQLETDEKDDPIEVGTPCDPGPGGGTGGGNPTPETFDWKVIKQVPRMMNTVWTQKTEENDLFNKYCPEVGLIWRTTARAGCVCIAVSQIVAYNESPSPLNCNGMQIDYSQMKEIFNYDDIWAYGSPEGQEMLARFCISIGTLCKTKYHSFWGDDWGFAWPWDAESCFEALGYENVSLDWGYDESRVLTSLEKGYPVFMSAIAKVISGHAWVIDGYMKRDYVSNKGTVLKSQTLVHCNWGWHGSCNGYFTSGIFKTAEAVLFDDLPTKHSKKEHYWYAFNTITYDKPRN